MAFSVLVSRLARIVAAAIAALLLAHHAASPAQARTIRPSPAAAHSDKAAPFYEGCMIGVRGTHSNACLYGDPHGHRVLFLFGDSHALQNFPALQVDARRRRWRLVVLTKRDCTPGSVSIRLEGGGGAYGPCAAWRRHVLRRIERAGRQGIVAISGDTTYTAYGSGGEELYGSANSAALEAGYLATIRQVRRAGAAVLVIRNTPEAPFDVPDCVAADISDPSACDFPAPHDPDRDFDVRAAHRAHVPLVDLTPKICSRGICHAVIHGYLVYRDDAHLTATYDRTLSGAFEPALRRVARAGVEPEVTLGEGPTAAGR